MKRFAFVLLAVLVLAVPAAAQVNTLERDDPRENARFRLGLLHVTPRVELTELGIDTNVFNTRGERERDFTFTLVPQADVWLPIARRGLIKANVGSDLVWYREFASERSLDPHVMVRGEAYLRRFTLFAENTYLRSRQRPTLELDLRSRRVEHHFLGGVDVRLTPKISFELNGSRATREFDGDDFFLGTRLEQTLNRETTAFEGVARYRKSVLTAFALRASRAEDRFPLSPERGSDSVRVTAGVELEPRALINGFAWLGVRHLNPVDESRLPEYKGLVADVGLSYTLFGATTLSVTYERDVDYSFEAAQPYYVDHGAGLRVRRALGPRFDVIGSVERHTYSYEDLLTAEAVQDERRVDTTWNYGGSLGYRVGRSGRVGLGVNYWRRDSTTRALREYEGLRIGTTATYEF